MGYLGENVGEPVKAIRSSALHDLLKYADRKIETFSVQTSEGMPLILSHFNTGSPVRHSTYVSPTNSPILRSGDINHNYRSLNLINLIRHIFRSSG